jgi:hypothetical protein
VLAGRWRCGVTRQKRLAASQCSARGRPFLRTIMAHRGCGELVARVSGISRPAACRVPLISLNGEINISCLQVQDAGQIGWLFLGSHLRNSGLVDTKCQYPGRSDVRARKAASLTRTKIETLSQSHGQLFEGFDIQRAAQFQDSCQLETCQLRKDSLGDTVVGPWFQHCSCPQGVVDGSCLGKVLFSGNAP